MLYSPIITENFLPPWAEGPIIKDGFMERGPPMIKQKAWEGGMKTFMFLKFIKDITK